MIESTAISPKIKELYDKVNKNANIFIDISHNLQGELNLLKEDREKLKSIETQVLDEIDITKNEFKAIIDKAIADLNVSTAKALKLHNELSDIQNLKETLFSLQKKLNAQSIDLSKTLEEIKVRNEKDLTDISKTIDYRLETELEKESQKIDARISLKVKQLENKVATYDQRMYSLNQTQVNDNKTAIKDIDKLKKDFIDLKNLVDESQQNLMDDFENFEGEFRKKLYNYELRFKEITKKLNNQTDETPIPEKVNKDDIIVGEKPKSKDFDKNVFEKEYKKIHSLTNEFSDLKDNLLDTSTAADKKANLALILSSISLIGVVLILLYIML